MKCRISYCEGAAEKVVVWGCLNMHVLTTPYCGKHTAMMLGHDSVRCGECYEVMWTKDALLANIGNVNEMFLDDSS